MKRIFCGNGWELKGAGWGFWVGTPVQPEKSCFLILFHQKRVKAHPLLPLPPHPPSFASLAVAGVECICAGASSCLTGTWEPGLDDWEALPSLHFFGTQTDLELLIPMLGWQVYAPCLLSLVLRIESKAAWTLASTAPAQLPLQPGCSVLAAWMPVHSALWDSSLLQWSNTPCPRILPWLLNMRYLLL